MKSLSTINSLAIAPSAAVLTAATLGAEDIAESWAMFVFAETEFAGGADDDGELDAVPEGTLAADKVAFFEDYPELVQLKDDILS